VRHRLYHRILGSTLLFVVLALLAATLAGHLLLGDVFQGPLAKHLAGRAQALAGELPAADRPTAELQAALERLVQTRGVYAAVWSTDGRRVAFTSTEVPPPPASGASHQLLTSPWGPALALTLPDGRRLVLLHRHVPPRPAGFLAALLLLAALLAVAAYPVARAVTRRLENLEAGVRRFGEGDLAARVEVAGADELASLASSFNLTAEHLERLVEAQRRVLASASHELRSPLTRLRMALELMRDDPSSAAARLDDAVAEVEELDTLVEELLLAGRLELQRPGRVAEAVDVGELLAAESSRTGASCSPRPTWLHVDPRLLRVLLRNLLENARRHGGGDQVEAGVEALGGDRAGVRVWVADRGPGVAEAERERIFEPFYRPPGHVETEAGGVGLGLYLVRRIAAWYDGDAGCRPRDGGGTVFEATLSEPGL
jgi:signal transduction histidine kinase